MRISDWSSDVCSSDLQRISYYFYIALAQTFLNNRRPTRPYLGNKLHVVLNQRGLKGGRRTRHNFSLASVADIQQFANDMRSEIGAFPVKARQLHGPPFIAQRALCGRRSAQQ